VEARAQVRAQIQAKRGLGVRDEPPIGVRGRGESPREISFACRQDEAILVQRLGRAARREERRPALEREREHEEITHPEELHGTPGREEGADCVLLLVGKGDVAHGLEG
jgi:hypothetical protein